MIPITINLLRRNKDLLLKKRAENCNEAKIILLEMVSDHNIVDCKNKKDAEEMYAVLFDDYRLVFYLDVHLDKISRHAGLKVIQLLKPLRGQDNDIDKFNNLSKTSF